MQDLGSAGGGYLETHRRSLSKTFYILLSTDSTPKMFQHDWNIIDWDVKHQHKQWFFMKILLKCKFFIAFSGHDHKNYIQRHYYRISLEMR